MIPIFHKNSHSIDVLLFNGTATFLKKELENMNIKVYELNKSSFIYNPLHIIRLIPYLKSYDIIHTHTTACQYYVALAKFISLSKIKLVTTEHNTTNRRRNIWWFKPIDRFIYKLYNAIISISPATTNSLSEYIGKNTNIYTIQNGINLSILQKESVINKNILVPNEKCILVTMIARFCEQKDQDTLIQAISLLPENYYLCLVGDGERRYICETLAEKLKIKERVIFTGIRNDVVQIIKASDIIVQSSHWEGFGLAAVEGMAAGKPVIASNVPGLAEVVKGAGLVFPLGDTKLLAHEIEELMNDPTYYKKIADQCRIRATNFDIKKMINEYEKIYMKL